jgi:hypothetical protein
MAYILNPGILNISGTITAAEVNALGTTPFVFNTPPNFTPIGFTLTANSGTIQPSFSSKLAIIDISGTRNLFLGTDPANVGLYTFFGFITNVVFSPQFGEATNINTSLPNNFNLLPEDLTDPTAGDYSYTYNFYGLIGQ